MNFRMKKSAKVIYQKKMEKIVKAIQATYENFENILFFMGKSRRVDGSGNNLKK